MVDRGFLDRNGFVCCPGLLSQREMARLGSGIDDLIERWETKHEGDPRYWNFSFRGNRILYRIHQLETLMPSVADILNGPAIMALRNELAGPCSATTAFAAILKLPFSTSPVPWHRDPIECPPGTIFNLSLYLDYSTEENGCLAVVPGSHRTSQKIPDDGSEPGGAILLPVSAGDVIVHDVLVIHGSAGNHGPTRRRSIVVEIQPARRADLALPR